MVEGQPGDLRRTFPGLKDELRLSISCLVPLGCLSRCGVWPVAVPVPLRFFCSAACPLRLDAGPSPAACPVAVCRSRCGLGSVSGCLSPSGACPLRVTGVPVPFGCLLSLGAARLPVPFGSVAVLPVPLSGRFGVPSGCLSPSGSSGACPLRVPLTRPGCLSRSGLVPFAAFPFAASGVACPLRGLPFGVPRVWRCLSPSGLSGVPRVWRCLSPSGLSLGGACPLRGVGAGGWAVLGCLSPS